MNVRLPHLDTYKTVLYIKLASMIFDLFILQMDVMQKLLSFFSLAKRSTSYWDGPPTFWLPLVLLASGLWHGALKAGHMKETFIYDFSQHVLTVHTVPLVVGYIQTFLSVTNIHPSHHHFVAGLALMTSHFPFCWKHWATFNSYQKESARLAKLCQLYLLSTAKYYAATLGSHGSGHDPWHPEFA